MKEPIRILHVIGSMNRGGAENMIMNYYRNIDRKMVQFDFVENIDKEAAFDSEIKALGGRIYRCPHYNIKNHFFYVRWWKNFLEKHAKEYTAIHGHLGSTAAIYLSLAKKYGLYTIAHSHSANGKPHNLKDVAYRLFSYPTRFVADYFFACSKAAGVTRYGKKVSQSPKCRVLNNAIDTGHFAFREELRSQVRNSLQIPPDALVVGHVGRFVEVKNHSLLLNIFSEVRKKNDSAILLLVGDGELRGMIEERAGKLGVAKYVVFLGEHSDVSPYYQAMDVFVFPSLYEGLPLTLVEAQTVGLPCVVSNRVSPECVVTHDLVTVQSLESSPQVWGEHILSISCAGRAGYANQVAANGYDITETVKWLQGFYLKIGG